MEIKRSFGIVRGKDDKIDAKRIALYAYEKRERLKLSSRASENIIALKRLLSMRDRLVKHRAGYKATVTELTATLPKKENLSLISPFNRMIKCLNKEIEIIENKMEAILNNDQELKEQCSLITSIKGVGIQTALFIIVTTEGFKKFDSWRKYASYCGTAPFPNRSGSSIRGKTKVSNLANKKVKSLLDMCAKSALQHDKQMKQYYQERIAKNRNAMSTINIIRNKLLSRIFAVVKRNSPYVDLLKYAT